MPAPVTAMALRESGGAVLAIEDTVYGFDFNSGAMQPIAAVTPEQSGRVFNDGKVDKRGRFVLGWCFAGLGNPPQPIGGLYGLGVDHKLAKLDDGIHYSNSPCWSPNGKTFYFSDSWEYACYAYDYDLESGQVSNKRLFADTRPLGGMPDGGATVDADGLVWIAIYQGGKVAAFRPNGKLERTVEMPVKLPASAMFGGPNLDQLYVPTIDPTWYGGDPEKGSGYLYVIEGLGARGLPEPRYAG